LPIISEVLIQLVYQYYNEIKFLKLKIIFDNQTVRNQFALFYTSDETEKPGFTHALREEQINDNFIVKKHSFYNKRM
jgi:hypothetical protein